MPTTGSIEPNASLHADGFSCHLSSRIQAWHCNPLLTNAALPVSQDSLLLAQNEASTSTGSKGDGAQLLIANASASSAGSFIGESAISYGGQMWFSGDRHETHTSDILDMPTQSGQFTQFVGEKSITRAVSLPKSEDYVVPFVHQVSDRESLPESTCIHEAGKDSMPVVVSSQFTLLSYSTSDCFHNIAWFSDHQCKGCETGPTVYRPYPRRLERLLIWRCLCKGSTFISVV